jgi:osmotically-inducible protein OsmY
MPDMNRVRKALTLLITATLTGALGACATSYKCGFDDCAGDARITAQVRALIDQHPALEAPNSIQIQTEHHVVYLFGQVNSEVERSEAEALARQVAGVHRVVDSINFGYEGR